MKAVDTRGKFCHVFDDKCLRISEDRLYNICKMEAGDKTCRYIVLVDSGFVCIKNTTFKEAIDNMVDEDKMTAKGDNCSGLVQGILSNANQKEKSSEQAKVKESSCKEGTKEEEDAEEKEEGK